tara:strand:+ start:1066 stop:1302 length:237 start_codon:yes stop_codon:yes gene_type:complete
VLRFGLDFIHLGTGAVIRWDLLAAGNLALPCGKLKPAEKLEKKKKKKEKKRKKKEKEFKTKKQKLVLIVLRGVFCKER